MNPFEFLDQLFNTKTRVHGLFVSLDFVILACIVLTQCQRQRMTDGRTDIPTVANTGLCIASYAELLTPCKNATTITFQGDSITTRAMISPKIFTFR